MNDIDIEKLSEVWARVSAKSAPSEEQEKGREQRELGTVCAIRSRAVRFLP